MRPLPKVRQRLGLREKCDKMQLNAIDCLKTIYKSEIYRMLEQEDSKYWHYGHVAYAKSIKKKLGNKF